VILEILIVILFFCRITPRISEAAKAL